MLFRSDVILGIASSGVHSNGYSLVRKIVADSGLSYDAEAPFASGGMAVCTWSTPSFTPS